MNLYIADCGCIWPSEAASRSGKIGVKLWSCLMGDMREVKPVTDINPPSSYVADDPGPGDCAWGEAFACRRHCTDNGRGAAARLARYTDDTECVRPEPGARCDHGYCDCKGGPGIVTARDITGVPRLAAAMIDDMHAPEVAGLVPGEFGYTTTEKGGRGILAAVKRRWHGRFWAQSWWF